MNYSVKQINDTNEVIDFALSFIGDKEFADPNHMSEAEFRESLDKYIAMPEKYRTIGIYDKESLIGVFSFLVIPEENYIEMLIALSRHSEAYRQMMGYLTENFSGYECFFVYNPRNPIFHKMLQERKAKFDTAQAKMDLKSAPEIKLSDNVIAYSEIYKEGYKTVHIDEERYWTADKVLACPERFHVFLALEQDKVVGYIDMEHSHKVNEPFELYVRPEYRRKGYGRALLKAAIVSNRPKGMMLHVDIDNAPAIHLYSSMGFEVDELGASILARLIV